jgi:glycosyltransferase involved in cell wall biosynthesis
MNEPLASCVCVTYNRPQLIGELLYCFLAQDYENKELIIINDQKDIVYVYNDPRVRIYNLQKRFPSLGAKRNYSRTTTKGDFIFTMDDDDLYYSDHISKLINFHLEHPEADIVADYDQEYSEWNNGKHIIQNLGCSFNGSCISKEYWLKTEFPNEKSCGEDLDFVKGANVMHIKGDTTFHYRWGLDIHHISGLGGDGRISYAIVTKDTPVGETKYIQIEPKLSEGAKEHFR